MKTKQVIRRKGGSYLIDKDGKRVLQHRTEAESPKKEKEKEKKNANKT